MKINFKRESNITGKMLSYKLEKRFNFFNLYRVYEDIGSKYKFLYKTTISL